MAADPLAHVVQGHRRFRRYAPRMLKALDIKATPVAIPLVNAAELIGGKIDQVKPTDFLRKTQNGIGTLKLSRSMTIASGKLQCCFIYAMLSVPETSGWGIQSATLI